MIRRYIAWRNRNARDERLREIVNRANVACCGTSDQRGSRTWRRAKVRSQRSSGVQFEVELVDLLQRGRHLQAAGLRQRDPLQQPQVAYHSRAWSGQGSPWWNPPRAAAA
jgi:hypothetical protein